MNKLTLTIASLATSLTMWGNISGINEPDGAGFDLRAALMYSDCIYNGTVDQLEMARVVAEAPESEPATAWLRAAAALRAGDDDAIGLLREFMDHFPASPLYVLAQAGSGDYYFMRGQYGEALDAYRMIDRSTLAASDADRIDFRQAYIDLLTGHYDQARSVFDRLSGSSVYGPKALFYKAYIAYATGNYEEALSLFGQADTSAAPGSAAPYYIAQINYLQHRWNEAFEVASAVLRNPTCPSLTPEAERIAGESLYNMGRRDAALPYLWRYASATQSPSPSAFYILGTSEYDAGHWSESIGLLQKVIGENNQLAQSAYLYLGQAYLHTGNNNAALMAFERAYRMTFDRKVSETAFYNFVAAKTDGGKMPFASSVGLLEDFMKSYPDSPYASKISAALVNGYLAENDYEAALSAINRVKKRTPELEKSRQRVLFMIGTRLVSNGNYADALKHFSEARRITGADKNIALQSSLWSAECNYRLRNFDAAAADYRAFLKQASRSDDNRPTAQFGLGYALFAKGDYAGAAKQFSDFLASDPDAPAMQTADALSRLGDCRYYTGNYTGAEEAYQQSYAANPATGDYALYQTAIMKGLRRDHAAKRSTIDQLIANFPNSGLIPDALLHKAESYAASNDTKSAIETYRSVADRYPATTQSRKAQLQLAITYLSSGNRAKAIDTYQNLVSRYPSSEEARVAVDDLKRIYADDGRLDDFMKFMAKVPDAPAVDPSEFDNLAFTAAEKAFALNNSTSQLEKYLADYPRGNFAPQALFYLATDAAANKNHSNVVDYTTRIVSDYPHSENIETVLLMKAEAETGMGRSSQALETYCKLAAQASDPQLLREARLGIMRSALKLKRYDDVLKTADMLTGSVAAADDADEIDFARGVALDGSRKAAAAREAWAKVVKRSPESLFGVQSAVLLAQSQLDANNLTAARRTVETMLDANPPYPYWMARGFIVLSDILRKQGQSFEADEYLRSLQSNYPGHETDIFNMIDERLK